MKLYCILMLTALAQSKWIPSFDPESLKDWSTQVTLRSPTLAQDPKDESRGNFHKSGTINRNDFRLWLSIQPNIAIDHVLENIGGSSSDSEIPLGAVIASPSKEAPNYYFQWTRDAAITIGSVISYLNDYQFVNRSMAILVENYIKNSYELQRVSNPSGTFEDLSGLGEPKFYVNNSAFTSKWGRPQNDGPALRSITVMNYMNLVHKYNDGRFVSIGLSSRGEEDVYLNIIKPDLQYIIKYWNAPGFDLWEEYNGYHFFTSMVQLRAVNKAIKFARNNKDYKFVKELKRTNIEILHFIQHESGFIDEKNIRIFENPGYKHKFGLDIASVIASIFTHQASDDFDTERISEIPFDVDDSHILNSLYGFIKDQKARYDLNQQEQSVGISLGRYPNDIYDGVGTSEGNPWFLSNCYASLVLYKKLFKLYNNKDDLVIFEENYNFYNEFITKLDQFDSQYAKKSFISLPYGSEARKIITDKTIEFADSFLKVVLDHITNEGELSEQFNRYNGFSQGAKNLTWSYSSCLSAMREREIVMLLVNEN